MDIRAEYLNNWIGSDVVDPQGEKLGKLADLFYRGDEPMILEISSGLTGRKHHLGALSGATVSRDYIRLASAAIVPTDGGLGESDLAALGQAAPGVAGIGLGELEGYQAREERLEAARAAAARADELEAEAARRAEEERAAGTRAEAASASAVEARRARERADQQAAEARQAAAEAQKP
jgi:hypothetical protein